MTKAGFTLIELLLSLAIFSIIGIATVHNLRQIRDTKDSAFKNLELYNAIRSAISLMRTDLSQAFHVLYDDLPPEDRAALFQNQAVPHTLFDGRKKEIVFTALSHRVFYEGLRESEQTEISFFLQNREGEPLPSLMKRESPFIDADLYSGGPVTTLLSDVEQLEFKYWDEKTGKWRDDWDSDGGDTRDRFPYAIKLKVMVAPPNKEKLEIETSIKIAFPNNEAVLAKFN